MQLKILVILLISVACSGPRVKSNSQKCKHDHCDKGVVSEQGALNLMQASFFTGCVVGLNAHQIKKVSPICSKLGEKHIEEIKQILKNAITLP